MKLTFWGTRGSIAVPGPDTLRYGGNTTCVEMELGDGEIVVIDAGTGIRPLSKKLMAHEGRLIINLLITHLHWDHLNGIPFFAPVYMPDVEIRVGGWPKGLNGLARLFDTRRSDGHFPVAFHELPSDWLLADELIPPRMNIGQTRIATQALHHPQGAIAFCFEEDGKKLIFMTDNELEPGAQISPEVLAKFCEGADILIHDSQYLPEEMDLRTGWGHSDWASVLKLGKMAGVKRLVLTHHDPARRDEQIDKFMSEVRREAGPELMVEAAYEGMTVEP